MKKLFLALTFVAGAVVSVQPQPAMAGLGKITDPGGVVVIEATLPGGDAADCADAECNNGPVAKAIVGALGNPQITIAALYDQMSTDVLMATKGQQIPWLAAKGAINVSLIGNEGHPLALVIGNGAYKHFPALKGAPRDGVAVGAGLEKLGFKTTKLIDSASEMLSAVSSFLQGAGPGDTVVIYYSGHGFSVNGTGYLPSLGAELADPDAAVRSSTSVDKLVDLLSASKATKKVLILDTHYPALSGGR